MAQTSIHIQPVKGGSEEHNKREKQLDYVRQDLSHLNEYWEQDTQSHRLEDIKQKYKASTRQNLQKKATPIREAVVVIENDTTMYDLKELATRLKEHFGIECFQIAIHKDEGYQGSGSWKPNLHAHMVFDWTDQETGKSIKLNRQQMAEIQTICASVLGMERGTSSDRKNLSAIQFKEKKAKEEAEKAVKTRIAAEQETEIAKRVTRRFEERKDNLQSEADSLADEIQSVRSNLNGLESRKNILNEEIQHLTLEKKQAEKATEEARVKAKQAEAAAVGGLISGGAKKIGNILGFGKESKALKEVPQQLMAAKEEGRAEGKKEAVTEIMKEANLNFGDKEATPSLIAKAWRARFDEAKQLRISIDRKVKEKDAEITYLKKSRNRYKDYIFSIWNGAREAVAILCHYLHYDHISVSFNRDEVATIDNALKSAQGIEERKGYGKELVSLAHAEYPGYADDSTRLWEIGQKVEEVAKMENRWQQNQGQNRNQGRGY